MHLVDLFQWLNDTSFSTSIREGDYLFPIIESFHVIALAFSVGVIMWVDLRMLELIFPDEPVASVVRRLEPWAIGGFVVMFASGMLLFVAEPMKCYTTLAFRIKAVMLVLLGLNVLYFHLRLYGHLDEWDRAGSIPRRAKFVAVTSIALLTCIIIAGRWTAYL